MKKILILFLSFCFIFVGVSLAGCGSSNIVLSGGPEAHDPILGNGGFAVQKGDYIYFASGFIEAESLGKTFSNAKGSVQNGGLYRAKMTEETVVEEDVETKKPVLTDIKLMVSKIVGFKGGGLYIFKNKLYFSSPSIVQDSSGVRYDLVTFYTCNLDGSDLTEFYQTKTWDSSSYFSMTMINEKAYLLIKAGETYKS